jgi:hypothetical protein
MARLGLKRAIPLLAIMTALALAVMACASPFQRANTATLIVANQTTQEICKLYVSPSTQIGWDGERLGGTQTIAVGESLTLADIEPGVYNLRAETCSGDAAERYDQTLEGEVEWTLTE